MLWAGLLQLDDDRLYDALRLWDPLSNKKWPEALFAHLLRMSTREFRQRYQSYTDLVADSNAIEMTEAHTEAYKRIFERVIPEAVPPRIRSRISSKLRKKHRDNQSTARWRATLSHKSPSPTLNPNMSCRIQPDVQPALTESSRGSITWKRIIWVGYPDKPGWNVETSNTLALEFYDDNCKMFDVTWLDDAFLRNLDKGLQPFYKRRRGQWTLHQGLVTMLIARQRTSRPIEIRSWAWLIALLENNDLPAYLSVVPSSTVFMLNFTTQKPENLDEVYGKLGELQKHLPFQIRCFPSLEELLHERQKVPDVQILDGIARQAGPDFSFRPVTCAGGSNCVLADHEITYEKRSHSGSGSHVKEVRRTVCPSRHPAVFTVSRGFSTFHQQYVPTLKSFGEFRVFVVGGRVIGRARTKWNQEKNILAVKAVDDEDFECQECRGLRKADLDRFCLYMVDQLLAQKDAKVAFESLRIGVRLDIGVWQGLPFVVEISRLWDAHFFSYFICPEPRISICAVVASALCAYFLEQDTKLR